VKKLMRDHQLLHFRGEIFQVWGCLKVHMLLQTCGCKPSMTGAAGEGVALPLSDTFNKADICFGLFQEIIHLLCMHAFSFLQLYFIYCNSHIRKTLHFAGVCITKGIIFCLMLM
jgi:hypothetical protein